MNTTEELKPESRPQDVQLVVQLEVQPEVRSALVPPDPEAGQVKAG